MIQHLVLIEWKPEASEADVADVVDAVPSLARIEGVVSADILPELGLAKPEYRRDIRHVLLIRMRDIETLKGFGPDPIHRAFGAKLMPHVAQLTIVDHRLEA